MSELKFCPFCGGEAETLTAEHAGGYLFCIMCNDCRSRGDVYDTEAEAIAAWNSRATDGTLTAEQVRGAIFNGSTYASYDGVKYYADGINMQAIADELNSRAERTCKDANTRFDAWVCSECKCTLLLMFDDYGEPSLLIDGVADVPHYCPSCGARVIKSEQYLVQEVSE